MARCSSASCHRCNPPNAKAYRALSDAIDSVERETPQGGDFWKNDDGEEIYTAAFDHPDTYDLAFGQMLSVYEAGMKNALRILREELAKYED